MKNLLKEYFFESLAGYPERDALEVQGEKYSYQALYEIVSLLIAAIEKQNIKDKAIVVLNDHSVYSYASILAVQFSGNAVLPLEATWPAQRVENILEQVKPAAFLVSKTSEGSDILQSKLALFGGYFIEVGSGEILHNNSIRSSAGDYKGIAYIIFTSGSTGSPKGVPVKQESINVFLKYYKENYDFKPTDRFLQVYEITFDVAYFSFLVPLCIGACCCILISRSGAPKYLSIINDLMTLQITVVSMVPTVLPFIQKYIRKEVAPTVRYSFFSGDALYHTNAVEWQKFVPNAAIYNCYGPTETTIVCTSYSWEETRAIKELHHDIVPLGKPFPGMRVKIIDGNNGEVAEGQVGELAFSGPQVIDRYLGETGQEKFFTTMDMGLNATFYKTGDLASLNEYGNLIFHGRKDHQVKINGYRVELEEVQLALQKLTGSPCIVVKKKGIQNIDYLKAFIAEEAQDVEKLKTALCNYLPDYMIPAEFEFISQLPLLKNGKIDKSYLQSL